MGDTSPSRPGQEDIIKALRWLSRRDRLNQALKDAALSLGLFLLPFLAFQILPLLLAREIPAQNAILGLWAAGLAVRMVLKQARRGSLTRAAGAADARTDLKDEMKTAYHFIREGRGSLWIDLLIRRAAETARDLDPRRIVPTVTPRGLLLADGLLVVLVLLLWMSPHRADPGLELFAPDPSPLSAVEEQVRDIQDLLRTPGTGEEADDDRHDRRDEALRRIDKSLRRLDQGESSLADALQELQEAENILTEGSLDLGALQEEMEEAAENLQGPGPMSDVADALRRQQLDEAAELLRSLAEKTKPESAEALDELLDRVKQAQANSDRLKDWMEALRQAAEALGSQEQEEAERLLSDAARDLESLNEKMKAEQRMIEAGAQLEQVRFSLAKNARLQRLSDQIDREQALENKELQSQLSTLAFPDSDDTGDGNPEGYPTGPAKSSANPEEDAPTSLEVHLEREMLTARDDPQNPVPEEISEIESKEQKSMLNFAQIRQRSSYAEAEVMSPERIPWRYRQLVRNYFLAIRRDSEQ